MSFNSVKVKKVVETKKIQVKLQIHARQQALQKISRRSILLFRVKSARFVHDNYFTSRLINNRSQVSKIVELSVNSRTKSLRFYHQVTPNLWKFYLKTE